MWYPPASLLKFYYLSHMNLLQGLKVAQLSQNWFLQESMPNLTKSTLLFDKWLCTLFWDEKLGKTQARFFKKRGIIWFFALFNKKSLVSFFHTGVYFTDKRTDVWSRDFIIWRINSGLWAVGLGWTVKEKGLGRLWATFLACFFTFSGSKKNFKIFLKTP